MKRFIKNCIIISIPFLAYLFLIVLVDPFNYLNSSRIIDNNNDNISKSVEPHLFKIIKFQNEPKKNVVLGDSRSNGLFNMIGSPKWSNLAYEGGSIKEINQTFWWLTGQINLDTVIIGLNLNLYNKYNKRFWVEETLERKKSFVTYAYCKYTFQSSLLIIRSYFKKEESAIGKPQLSKEEFWQFQLNQIATKFYENYAYPDNYFVELKEISNYCSQNNIKLIFWIPPTHIEFQQRKVDFGLEEFDQQFVSDLQSLGDLYDFDFNSEITRNKEDYRDPMHFSHKIGEIIYQEIFYNSPQYSRFTEGKYPDCSKYE